MVNLKVKQYDNSQRKKITQNKSVYIESVSVLDKPIQTPFKNRRDTKVSPKPKCISSLMQFNSSSGFKNHSPVVRESRADDPTKR